MQNIFKSYQLELTACLLLKYTVYLLRCWKLLMR
jgi:hypothetical protein